MVLAPHVDWVHDSNDPLRFARDKGMPDGTMTVAGNVAISRVVQSSNGTIDFDIKPLAYDDTGIVFRRNGEASGEMVYLRANPDCPAADDCIQYARSPLPDAVGHLFELPAAGADGFRRTDHVHLIIAGEKMLVTVNHAAGPTLVVPRLQGATMTGGIAFKGPAIYANLVIRPGPATALSDVHEARQAADTITSWLAAPPTALPVNRPVGAAEIPSAGSWRAIAVERNGLVNLSRAFDVHRLSIGWLRTTVTAATPAAGCSASAGLARSPSS
nr:hypothetical protein [uncultured Lichenicoccus sp.]